MSATERDWVEKEQALEDGLRAEKYDCPLTGLQLDRIDREGPREPFRRKTSEEREEARMEWLREHDPEFLERYPDGEPNDAAAPVLPERPQVDHRRAA